MKKSTTTWRRYVFFAVWILSTAIFGWQIVEREYAFDSPHMWLNLMMLLFCTIALLWRLSCPLRDGSSDVARTKWGWFILVAVISVCALFALRTVVGPPLLFGLPVVAVSVLASLRRNLTKQEVLYALGLSLVAGIAGLGAQWVPFHPVVWSVLQVFLVSTGLLAGWAVLRHAGLLEQGVGYSRFLSEGTASALRGFLQGLLIGLPWAMSLVVMGGSDSETWVHHWWQPLLAINPGVAEEAWGGFHFWLDFVKFAAAYLLNTGLWPNS